MVLLAFALSSFTSLSAYEPFSDDFISRIDERRLVHRISTIMKMIEREQEIRDYRGFQSPLYAQLALELNELKYRVNEILDGTEKGIVSFWEYVYASSNSDDIKQYLRIIGRV